MPAESTSVGFSHNQKTPFKPTYSLLALKALVHTEFMLEAQLTEEPRDTESARVFEEEEGRSGHGCS